MPDLASTIGGVSSRIRGFGIEPEAHLETAMATQLRTSNGYTIADAGAEVLAEFADVERELASVGITVPPASPSDTVTARFLMLMVHADLYDRAHEHVAA